MPSNAFKHSDVSGGYARGDLASVGEGIAGSKSIAHVEVFDWLFSATPVPPRRIWRPPCQNLEIRPCSRCATHHARTSRIHAVFAAGRVDGEIVISFSPSGELSTTLQTMREDVARPSGLEQLYRRTAVAIVLNEGKIDLDLSGTSWEFIFEGKAERHHRVVKGKSQTAISRMIDLNQLHKTLRDPTG